MILMTKNFVVGAILLCLLSSVIEITSGIPLKKPSRTCIIGAGYSGLATGRYLIELGVEDFTIFEATRHVGGTWRFDPSVGIDEDGVPVFTSMYKNLRTNTPRQTMEFARFPFPDDTPSYPTGPCFHKYILNFTRTFNIDKYVQLRSYVTSVKRVKDQWEVTYMNTETKASVVEDCANVVVSNGPYGKVKRPKIQGEELFKGKIIHSHDYKDTEVYANRRVLLIGAGPSGLDLATHLANKTAKLVHSHHLKYNQPFFSESYVKKPDVEALTANGVVFVDGTFEEVDDVIYCTGFDFYHPFLDSSSGVTVTEKYVLPLYQQIVNIRHPSMFFVGFAKTTITRLLDTQAEYSARVIAGAHALPSQEEMLRSWFQNVYYLKEQGKKIVDVNLVGPRMDNYFANLTAEAGVGRVAPVLTEIRDFNAVIRLDDLLNYRDYEFNVTDDYHYDRYYQPMPGTPCPLDLEL